VFFIKKVTVRIFGALIVILIGLIGVLFISAFTADNKNDTQVIICEGDIGIQNVLYKVGLKTVDDSKKSLTVNEIYTDDFGGAFIDDDGQLIILLTENSKSFKNISYKSVTTEKLFQSQKGTQKILIKPAKFSEKELMFVNDYLVERMSQLNIFSVGVDTAHNSLEIGIESNDNVFKIEEKIKSDVLRDCIIANKNVDEMLSFLYLKSGDIPVLTANVSGGSTIRIQGKNQYSTASVGYPKKSGFITCGHHGLPVGSEVYNNNNSSSVVIGIVKAVKMNGSDDSSYVEFTPGHGFYSSIPYNVSSNYPLVGSGISQVGYSGSYDAIVLELNYSYYSNGITWKNLIRTSAPTQMGDSGGPCFNDRYYDRDLTRMVYGITHAGTGSNSVCIKYENITT